MTDAEVGTAGFLDQLGPRARRRPSPRVGVTLAAAGSALVVLGALVESGNRLAESSDGGDPNRWPGVLLCALVIGAGYALIAKFRHGPLATAGVAASAVAVPPLLFFLTLDARGTEPFSIDAVLGVSFLAWALSYAFGPSRGRGFYLGAALIALWLFVLEQTEGVLSLPFRLIPAALQDAFGSESSALSRLSTPNTTNLGAISLLFAGAYLVMAVTSDRRQRSGLGTPFAFVGLITLYAGVSLLASDLQEIGTGMAFIVTGVGGAIVGALGERRGSTWAGGTFAFLGAVVIAAKLADGNADALAAALAVFGVLAVLLGNLFPVAWGEPPETDPGPSRFTLTPNPMPPAPPSAPDHPWTPPPPSPPPPPALSGGYPSSPPLQ